MKILSALENINPPHVQTIVSHKGPKHFTEITSITREILNN